jgi:hypothetical protein
MLPHRLNIRRCGTKRQDGISEVGKGRRRQSRGLQHLLEICASHPHKEISCFRSVNEIALHDPF